MDNTINVHNLIILDASGSMRNIYNQALTGINETIAQIRCNQEKYPDQHHTVSIVTFEGEGPSGVRIVRDRVPIMEVSNLTGDDYRLGGCTPLYDAMGVSMTNLEKKVGAHSAVFVTIITDGYENASKEYSGAAIKRFVEAKREAGWTFAYIGANQDAVEVAHELSISNALDFEASEEGTVRMMIKYRKAQSNFGEKLHCMAYAGLPLHSVDDLWEDPESEENR